MAKYNSKRVIVDDITFDSKQEADYYLVLKELVKQGEIKNFSLQPKYELIPKFEKNGVKYRSMTYTPDFLVEHNDNQIEAVDVKGFGTQQGDMRRKLFDYLYPDIKLTWLSYSKKWGGWVEYDELKRLRKNNKKRLD